jgi:hypothetical protein
MNQKSSKVLKSMETRNINPVMTEELGKKRQIKGVAKSRTKKKALLRFE